MGWLLWMGAGAATAVLALLLLVLIANAVDARASRRRQAVYEQRYAAERNMQQLVQNTISQMLDAARRFQ